MKHVILALSIALGLSAPFILSALAIAGQNAPN
jgi:hypothetical protein